MYASSLYQKSITHILKKLIILEELHWTEKHYIPGITKTLHKVFLNISVNKYGIWKTLRNILKLDIKLLTIIFNVLTKLFNNIIIIYHTTISSMCWSYWFISILLRFQYSLPAFFIRLPSDISFEFGNLIIITLTIQVLCDSF